MSGEHGHHRVLLDDDVGTLFGGVGEEVDEAGEGNGKDAGARPDARSG